MQTFFLQGLQLAENRQKFALPVATCKTNIEKDFRWVIYVGISKSKMVNINSTYNSL